jgi:hypothetical protein
MALPHFIASMAEVSIVAGAVNLTGAVVIEASLTVSHFAFSFDP